MKNRDQPLVLWVLLYSLLRNRMVSPSIKIAETVEVARCQVLPWRYHYCLSVLKDHYQFYLHQLLYVEQAHQFMLSPQSQNPIHNSQNVSSVRYMSVSTKIGHFAQRYGMMCRNPQRLPFEVNHTSVVMPHVGSAPLNWQVVEIFVLLM